MPLSDYQIWFLTGSQHLYGPEAIEQVGAHSREIAAYLDDLAEIPAPSRLQAGADHAGKRYSALAATPTPTRDVWAWSPGCTPSRRRRTGSPV